MAFFGAIPNQLVIGSGESLRYNGAAYEAYTPYAGGSGINSLNGLNGSTQTFAIGSSGTDFNISSTGTIHTFNIPDASAANRGLITTGSQTIAGVKTFSSDVISTGFKSGSGGLFFPSNHTVLRDSSGNNVVGVNTTAGTSVCSANGWSIGATYDAPDVILLRDAANILAQRNSTNLQTYRIYNTYTSSTNNEFLQIRAVSAANFEIGPQNGSGGGTLRGLTIGGYTAGSSTITPWLTFTNTGVATFGVAGTTNGQVVIGAAASINAKITIGGGASLSLGGASNGLGTSWIIITDTTGSSGPAAFRGGSTGSIGFGNTSSNIGTVDIAMRRSSSNTLGLYTTETGSTNANLLCANITLADASNIIVNTTTGTKIGTGSTQKLGFWNATPVVQNTGWSAANYTTKKSFDRTSYTMDELADLVCTLLDTIKTYGLIGA